MTTVTIYEGFDRAVVLWKGTMVNVPRIGEHIRLERHDHTGLYKPRVTSVIHDVLTSEVEVSVR